MTSQSPVSLLHKASGWSIAWGVLLIVFGILAVGSPLLAAVAVNALIAWLIVLGGVVHLVLAFHARGAGSVIWKLLVGVAYICLRGIFTHASAAGGGVTDAAAGVAVPDRGRAGHRAVRQSTPGAWSGLVAV